MGRISDYEKLDKFKGNEVFIVETEEGTKNAAFSLIQNKINDCVDDKANALNFSDVAVINDTEEEYVIGITVGANHIVTPNLKGERGAQGVQGTPGKDGMQYLLAKTYEELMTVMTEIMADFANKTPVCIVTPIDPNTYQENATLTMIYIFDSGTGSAEDAMLVMSPVSETAFTKNLAEAISRNSLKNVYNKKQNLEIEYGVNSSQNITFNDVHIKKIRMTAVLPACSEPVSFKIVVNTHPYTCFLADSVDADSKLYIEYDMLDRNAVHLNYTFCDSHGKEVRSGSRFENYYFKDESFTRARLNFTGYANTEKYRLEYISVGG